MAGRKPLPDYIHEARGTDRPDRKRDRPATSTDPPRPPRWLGKEAKRIFRQIARRLEEMRVASASHTEMLALAAMRLAEVEMYTRQLDELGSSTYETEGTMGQKLVKVRPEVALRSQAARHAQSLLSEFGLSAASLNKVAARKDLKTDNPFGRLVGDAKK